MSTLQRPSYPRPTKSFSTPRVVPSASNRIHTHYPPASVYSRRGSGLVRDEVANGRMSWNRDRVVQHTFMSKGQKGTPSKLWTSFRDLFLGGNGNARQRERPTYPFAPYDRWKPYGSFPRPVATRVHDHNQTPRYHPPMTTNVDSLRSRVRCSSDFQYPTNRPGRTEGSVVYPQVPERPRAQRPPTHDVQPNLHPYLQHRCNSPHPISFNIGLGPSEITFNTHNQATGPFDPVHLTQPATHPPVTRMRIESIAHDPLPHFPWPIHVENARGITCADVCHAITRSFLQYVSEHEYNTWTSQRKKMAARAYYSRVNSPLDPAGSEGVLGAADGLRRIDYMGEKVIFRGLERGSAMIDGMWLMHIGSERSRASCFGSGSMNKVG